MSDAKRNMKALNNIGYGLYIVTSNDGKRDNGLVVNTVIQITSSPERIAVTINKSNYSHDVIKASGKMNVNILSTKAPFSIFEKFGFKSGRDTDKFKGECPLRAANGLVLLSEYINSYMSLEVCDYIDLGTHGMFICSVVEADVLSDDESITYAYYHKNVKPKPIGEKSADTERYVCTVCGYVHEGELPDDFVCPLCKHGAADFEKVQ